MANPPFEVMEAGPSPVSPKCKGIVVFLHGWPDTNALWEKQVERFSNGGYHCVCLSLPNYSGYDQKNAWGIDFPDLRDDLISAIQTISRNMPVHIIAHDWGAAFAYMIERKKPDLVLTLTTIDVAGRIRISSLAGLLLVPAYQLWLTTAFILGNIVPFIGKPIGDWMTWACATFYARAPHFSPLHGSHINYPYFYFYKQRIFGGSGGMAFLKQYSPRCPTFYCYGAKKPFMFHSKGWIKEMEDREDCQIQPFPCGHWVQVQCAEEFSTQAFDFISKNSFKK